MADEIESGLEDIGDAASDLISDPVGVVESSWDALRSGDFELDPAMLVATGFLTGGSSAIASSALPATPFRKPATAASAASGGAGSAGMAGFSFPGFGGFGSGLMDLVSNSPEQPAVPETPTLTDADKNAQLLMQGFKNGRKSTILTGGEGDTGTTQKRGLTPIAEAINMAPTSRLGGASGFRSILG